MLMTTVEAKHVPPNFEFSAVYSRGKTTTMGYRNAAGVVVVDSVMVNVVGGENEGKLVLFNAIDVSIKIKIIIYFNTRSSDYDYSRNNASIDTQYAEYQHVADYWTARDKIIIPFLDERLKDTFVGLAADAEDVLRKEIIGVIYDTTQETRQRYDLPKGSAPHSGGPLLVPSDFPGFP